jgi:GT2 family glycosyltransferase
VPFELEDFSFPIVVIRNATPLGFAANHDQAFTHAKGRYFCVINPDIRLDDDPFQTLIACLQDTSVAVAGPIVLSADGTIEDSARRFPSPFIIICKAFGKCKGSDYVITDKTIFPDWVGGMFMLFRYETFEQLGGFSQKYFLYYEDVDLCARIKLHGYKVALCPGAKVVHEARRDSHREMKFFKWHLTSMLRFFLSPEYWRLQFRR